jgi:tRNA A-37 threonylcarbamoyl transferase component Bud32
MTILKNKNNFWSFLGHCEEKPFFETIQASLQQSGDRISKDPISQVVRADINDQQYFIKQYHQGGKGVRRLIGRSRAAGEWSNLLYFASLDIPIPRIVAYGRERINEQTLEVLVTAGVEDSIDLATLARQEPERFNNRKWFSNIMQQVADCTRKLHDDGFVHWDLKWRNVLLQDHPDPKIFFFDCPLGRKQIGPLRRRGAIKDLACLDKIGKKVLTRTQRLRFFLLYRQTDSLDPASKKTIRNVIKFFDKREQLKEVKKIGSSKK